VCMAVTTAVLWGGNTFIIENRMNNTNGNMYTLKPRTQGRPIEVGCLARHKEVQCVKV